MIGRVIKPRIFFKAIYSLLLFSVISSACTQDTLPENNDSEGVAVNFVLPHGISDIDTDTEFVPMGRNNTPYFNFIPFNAEFTIYRKIENKYILQSYQYVTPGVINYPNNRRYITSDTPLSLDDLKLKNSYTLQPGEYRACIGVNMPYYAVSNQYPKPGEPVSSIIGKPDIFWIGNPIRDVFFTYQDFKVKKTSQLEESNEIVVSFDKPLCRKASPVRFILIDYKKELARPSIKCQIKCPDAMPVGIDINGNVIIKGVSSEILEPHSVNLPVMLKANEKSYFLPSYLTDKDELTSIFVPCTKESVKLDFVITEVFSEGASAGTYNCEIPDVEVFPNKITNVVLQWNSDGISHITDEKVLDEIKKVCKEQYPEIPFNFIEYNYKIE